MACMVEREDPSPEPRRGGKKKPLRLAPEGKVVVDQLPRGAKVTATIIDTTEATTAETRTERAAIVWAERII